MPPEQNRHAQTAILASALASLATTLLGLVSSRRRKRGRVSKRSRRPAKFRRAALLHPVRSKYTTPRKQILSCGVEDDFLVATNCTKQLIAERMLPYFELEHAACNFGSPYRRGVKTRGRRPLLHTIDLLGMALWYLKTRSTVYSLSPIFGIVSTSVGVWLDYSLEVLYRFVKKKERTDYEIKWPNMQEMKASAARLEGNRINGLLLSFVFGVTDGDRMPCADYTDVNLQNAYYEGYTQSVEVTNLFVFNFFGELIHTAINYPGSSHDNKSAMASGLYFPKLSDEMTPPGMAILGDIAFVNKSSATNGKVLRGRKTNETADIPESSYLAAVDIILQRESSAKRAMPSERRSAEWGINQSAEWGISQSTEWGIRAIKGPFARFKVPLPADANKRLRLLTICCHLFNFRTRFVGLNKIRTTYGHSQPGV